MLKKKAESFWSDFKAFISKGNVLDLAVGVVVGGAFGKITTSLVNDIIMPPIGLLIGGVNFDSLVITLKEATADAAAVTINYGTFLQTIIDFLLIAFCIFVVIKIIRNAEKKLEELKNKDKVAEEPAPAPEPPKPSEEVLLLREIRDELKNRK